MDIGKIEKVIIVEPIELPQERPVETPEKEREREPIPA